MQTGTQGSEEHKKQGRTKVRHWLQLIFRSCDEQYLVTIQEDHKKDGIYSVPRFLPWETECTMLLITTTGYTGEETGQEFETFVFERKIQLQSPIINLV